ncbi:MAG: NUDIX domain-containing protein [Pseudomonadales bacterium]
MPATDPNEPFEIFSASGQALGTAPRGQVHREGQWHRSTHVFLYDPDGRLLLQQRSSSKDLYANAWDYSVGEHLQPGEEYLAAALRGLQEELAVTLTTLAPLGAPTASEFIAQDGRAIDREFQQAYRGVLQGSSTQQIRFDPTEVAAVRWLSKTELRRFTNEQRTSCTPWLLRDLERFELLWAPGD